MEPPAWASSLGESFDPNAAPLVAYSAASAWVRSNLSAQNALRIEIGHARAWPIKEMDNKDTLKCLRFILMRVAPGELTGNVTLKACWRKLVTLVHPDKWMQADSRVFYAALA